MAGTHRSPGIERADGLDSMVSTSEHHQILSPDTAAAEQGGGHRSNHHLLHQVSPRDLGSGEMLDEEGHLRLIFETPDWEDFVHLAVAEIRLFGAGSIQVVRRLHAMFEHLSEVLPPQRIPALCPESVLLHRAVERAFPDPEARRQAGISD
jgi:uncharacterized membrane protein